MTQAAIGADILETLDIHVHFGVELPFNAVFRLDLGTQASGFLFRQILDPSGRADVSRTNDVPRQTGSDSVDVGEGHLHPFVHRQIDAGDTSHGPLPLSLTLLVTWILANNPDDSPALDELAVFTDFLDGCFDFHRSSPAGSALFVSVNDSTAGQVVR